MNVFAKMGQWAEMHYPKWLSFVRIILGLFLVFKGVQFMMGVEKIQTIPGGIDSVLYYVMLFHIVIFVHFVGGIFIAIGLYTRLADIIQIPMIVGALLLVSDPARMVISGGKLDLILSIVVLALLVVFLVFGSGKISIDSRRLKNPRMT
jgi:uncharacterized membrane protein YphA (DoxX/SURF4 family)